MNTSMAESIFCWFRGYASTFNSMSALRHRFIVMVYCKEHNALVQAGHTEHLNEHSANAKKIKRTKKGSGYACCKGAKRVKK